MSQTPFRVLFPDELDWITRPHEAGEPARHVTELSELAGFAHTRANVWRYEPGARGRRHRHPLQEETFVVPAGALVHVPPRTPLQSVNHGDEDVVVYVYGTPPEDEHAELLEPAT